MKPPVHFPFAGSKVDILFVTHARHGGCPCLLPISLLCRARASQRLCVSGLLLIPPSVRTQSLKKGERFLIPQAHAARLCPATPTASHQRSRRIFLIRLRTPPPPLPSGALPRAFVSSAVISAVEE